MNNVSNQKTVVVVIILLLLAGNIFFGMQYIAVQKQLRQTQAQLETQRTNDKVLAFTKLFIEKVLKAQTEVDFETRLQLENAVRSIGDEQIFTQWQRFTESGTEIQAQEEVKNLLSLLIKKVEM